MYPHVSSLPPPSPPPFLPPPLVSPGVSSISSYFISSRSRHGMQSRGRETSFLGRCSGWREASCAAVCFAAAPSTTLDLAYHRQLHWILIFLHSPLLCSFPFVFLSEREVGGEEKSRE
ncbi:hypothetical protein E2C01_090318 [Portunus trituberculatus]|uniref:Uncharacterized protein n=1 Tax=Portunus trituberculatus TaxID=210409 RepID=A0A5B7JG93_PORTR|nr:hypothetical protein [Portunus trituberculatus]